MDKTKYVEEWTAKHLHYPSPDAASLSRRKLPAAPGNSSPDSASEGIAASYDYSKDLLNNTELNNKSNIWPFDRFRNLSMPKRNTTGLEQGYVKNELSMKQNARYIENKRSEVIKQSLIMSSSSSGSGSAPNSARSGSSGYQSRQNVERLSTRRKQMSSTSLTKASSRSNSCLTSHEADFQAWKRRKEYKPFSSSTR